MKGCADVECDPDDDDCGLQQSQDEFQAPKNQHLITATNGTEKPQSQLISCPEDPRYFDKRYFPQAKVGQHWAEARREQLRAIETREIESRLRQCHIKDSSREAAPRQGGAAAFPGLIPRKPYCTNSFELGLRIRPRDQALKYRYIQFNGPKILDWLSFDIDTPNAYRAAEDANLPPPTIISINPENGHGLLSYLLITPVHRFPSSKRHPIEWLADIQRGMVRRLAADRSFHGVALKNPLHHDWRTSWLCGRPYSLEDLDCELDSSDKRPFESVSQEFGEGRNCRLFNDLRVHCYSEWRKYHGNKSAFSNRVICLATEINQQFALPLSSREIISIAKSVERWIDVKFSDAAFSEIQRKRANRRWSGVGHVSAEKTKPWEAMGVSRATYYRQKKRLQVRFFRTFCRTP